MMIRYGGVGGLPLWFSITGLVLFALLIGSFVWLVVALTRPGHHVRMSWYAGGGGYGPRFRNPALDELDLAYARGQLTRDEYFQKRTDLTGWGPPGDRPGSAGGGGAAPVPPGPGAPTSS
jgi:hypothetical protein